MPFDADIVREDLGTSLTRPASTDPAQLEFVVQEGDTAGAIADRLEDQGLILDARAFVFVASERELTGELQTGTFILRRNMTPDQLVTALLAAPEVPYVELGLRTGLRLEQITALLQTLPVEMDPRDFYDLATDPPAALIADYPWLKKILDDAPKGTSLEGFLWPAAYRILPDTTPEELLRLMLDKWIANVGPERLTVPEGRGLNFYQVLSLASIVEREAVLDEERPLIAGVYLNRINNPEAETVGLLNADPTLQWALATREHRKAPVDEWGSIEWWPMLQVAGRDVELPPRLADYQTYRDPGLPPAPIASPRISSIEAVAFADTESGYFYFVAGCPNGERDGSHYFARTFGEHQQNIARANEECPAG
jgi:UPF0755 protein